ncbi:izumo sperm-egg fusion protein 1 isoform X2 [Pantherophis guttatus]|uniref:Izumo sperm-egg fusion protein 1 isoform X2 n=1 Tax=Pantherophis guttatus TaxID=94885 RepID=A0A6P9BWS1_PANGU|nr:izumo sperm-egg fusion protein 1 isoform X2 [Pantherophis guttatus]
MVITGSQGCLKCSKEAMALQEEFKNSYLENKLRGDPDLKTKLKQLLDNTLERLWQQPIHPQKYMGIIDEITLKKLTVYFKRSLNQIKENNFEGEQLFNEVMWSLQKLMTYFEEVMPQVAKLYCSNECGKMFYTFISCGSCATNQQSCSKNLKCGERKVQVEMDEDLILDCALKWHKASHGVKTYRFYRMVGNKEKLMASGADSFLTKKEANMNDAGTYRCKMVDTNGVLPPKEKTTWFTHPPPLVSRPSTLSPPPSSLLSPPLVTVKNPLTLGISSRAPPPEADWTAWKVSGITGVYVIIVIWLRRRKRMMMTMMMTRVTVRVTVNQRVSGKCEMSPASLKLLATSTLLILIFHTFIFICLSGFHKYSVFTLLKIRMLRKFSPDSSEEDLQFSSKSVSSIPGLTIVKSFHVFVKIKFWGGKVCF